jgi:hypothetical protein
VYFPSFLDHSFIIHDFLPSTHPCYHPYNTCTKLKRQVVRTMVEEAGCQAHDRRIRLPGPWSKKKVFRPVGILSPSEIIYILKKWVVRPMSSFSR